MGPSLQEKAALLRRRHILDAAIKVFAERGFHRATIRDVAAEAGVSDGTIYNAFENKNALLLGILDPMSEADTALGQPSRSPPADVRQFVKELLQRRWDTLTPEALDMLRIVLSEALINPELRELYIGRVIAPALALPEPAFQALAADGRIRPADVAMTLRIVTASVLGLVMLRLLGEAHLAERWEQVPDQLTDLLLDGMLPAPDGGADGPA